MTRDTCRLPNCDNAPGEEDADHPYNERKFCSIKHEVKYDHLKADADDARHAERERHTDDRHPGVKGEF